MVESQRSLKWKTIASVHLSGKGTKDVPCNQGKGTNAFLSLKNLSQNAGLVAVRFIPYLLSLLQIVFIWLHSTPISLQASEKITTPVLPDSNLLCVSVSLSLKCG